MVEGNGTVFRYGRARAAVALAGNDAKKTVDLPFRCENPRINSGTLFTRKESGRTYHLEDFHSDRGCPILL